MTKSLKELREAKGTATPIGSAPRRTPPKSFSKTSLGGTDLRRRMGSQKAGNQLRTPNIYEEIVEKVKSKLGKAGRTDTNNPADEVNTNIEQNSTNNY